MQPSKLLTELMKQHDALRAMMDQCELFADELEASGGDPSALTREVAKLRVAFDAHNRFEEQLLRPVLRELDAFGDVRVERMVAAHVDEHGAVRAQLGDGPTAMLRDAIDRLRVHLQAEERYFLSSKILRDDLISVEPGG